MFPVSQVQTALIKDSHIPFIGSLAGRKREEDGGGGYFSASVT